MLLSPSLPFVDRIDEKLWEQSRFSQIDRRPVLNLAYAPPVLCATRATRESELPDSATHHGVRYEQETNKSYTSQAGIQKDLIHLYDFAD